MKKEGKKSGAYDDSVNTEIRFTLSFLKFRSFCTISVALSETVADWLHHTIHSCVLQNRTNEMWNWLYLCLQTCHSLPTTTATWCRVGHRISLLLSNVESVGRPPSPQRTIRSLCRHAEELINCRAPDLNSDHTRPNTFSRLMELRTMCSGFTLQYPLPKKFDLAISIPKLQCVFLALSSAALNTFHSHPCDWIWQRFVCLGSSAVKCRH